MFASEFLEILLLSNSFIWNVEIRHKYGINILFKQENVAGGNNFLFWIELNLDVFPFWSLFRILKWILQCFLREIDVILLITILLILILLILLIA